MTSASTPCSMVGSSTGAKNGEWLLGMSCSNRFAAIAAATAAGSAPPVIQNTSGAPAAVPSRLTFFAAGDGAVVDHRLGAPGIHERRAQPIDVRRELTVAGAVPVSSTSGASVMPATDASAAAIRRIEPSTRSRGGCGDRADVDTGVGPARG